MRPYIDTARRYFWVIVIVLALTWGTGAAMAYDEYSTSFEADATIWTDRQSSQFEILSPQDPGLSSYLTPAQQQAGLISQLLVTRSFLQEVLQRASIPQPSNIDERTFFQEIGKRYRIDLLGTNLFRLSYRARDPRTGAAMVMAALAVRQDRLAETRSATTTAAATFYKTEIEVAQQRVREAESALAAFDQTHNPPFSATDAYAQGQLRLTLEVARTHVSDIQTRIETSGALPGILSVADSLDFQIVDTPLSDVRPSGGLRPAAVIAGTAGAAGLALVGLLMVVGTFLARGPARSSATSATEQGEATTPSASLAANVAGLE